MSRNISSADGTTYVLSTKRQNVNCLYKSILNIFFRPNYCIFSDPIDGTTSRSVDTLMVRRFLHCSTLSFSSTTCSWTKTFDLLDNFPGRSIIHATDHRAFRILTHGKNSPSCCQMLGSLVDDHQLWTIHGTTGHR